MTVTVQDDHAGGGATVGCFLIWGCPNTQQIMGYLNSAITCRIHEDKETLHWRHAVMGGLLLALSLLSLQKVSTFLYYQF